jgi:hypothetical protein
MNVNKRIEYQPEMTMYHKYTTDREYQQNDNDKSVRLPTMTTGNEVTNSQQKPIRHAARHPIAFITYFQIPWPTTNVPDRLFFEFVFVLTAHAPFAQHASTAQ